MYNDININFENCYSDVNIYNEYNSFENSKLNFNMGKMLNESLVMNLCEYHSLINRSQNTLRKIKRFTLPSYPSMCPSFFFTLKAALHLWYIFRQELSLHNHTL